MSSRRKQRLRPISPIRTLLLTAADDATVESPLLPATHRSVVVIGGASAAAPSTSKSVPTICASSRRKTDPMTALYRAIAPRPTVTVVEPKTEEESPQIYQPTPSTSTPIVIIRRSVPTSKSSPAVSPLSFQCTACDFECTSKDDLVEHRETEHEQLSTHAYKCARCPCSFESFSGMLKHKRASHLAISELRRRIALIESGGRSQRGRAWYKCQLCDASFDAQLSHVVHEELTHGVRPYVQNSESRTTNGIDRYAESDRMGDRSKPGVAQSRQPPSLGFLLDIDALRHAAESTSETATREGEEETLANHCDQCGLIIDDPAALTAHILTHMN